MDIGIFGQGGFQPFGGRPGITWGDGGQQIGAVKIRPSEHGAEFRINREGRPLAAMTGCHPAGQPINRGGIPGVLRTVEAVIQRPDKAKQRTAL